MVNHPDILFGDELTGALNSSPTKEVCVIIGNINKKGTSDLHMFCAKIVGIHMDDERYNTEKLGRYGSTGYMYNIHRPIDPDTGNSTETQVGFIDGLTTYDNL